MQEFQKVLLISTVAEPLQLAHDTIHWRSYSQAKWPWPAQPNKSSV